MSSSFMFWVQRLYHLCLTRSDWNRGLSQTPVVIDFPRFGIWSLVFFLVAFSVVILPFIGCDFPIYGLRFSVGFCPSTLGFGGVFPVVEVNHYVFNLSAYVRQSYGLTFFSQFNPSIKLSNNHGHHRPFSLVNWRKNQSSYPKPVKARGSGLWFWCCKILFQRLYGHDHLDEAYNFLLYGIHRRGCTKAETLFDQREVDAFVMDDIMCSDMTMVMRLYLRRLYSYNMIGNYCKKKAFKAIGRGKMLFLQHIRLKICLYQKAYNIWDQNRKIKSKQTPRRRCWIRKYWYLLMATEFQLTEAVGFIMWCVKKSLSLELLAKHTIRIRGSIMEKENNRVKTQLAVKPLIRKASSNSLILFNRFQQMAHISAYVIICFSEILSIDYIFLWISHTCIMILCCKK